MSNFDETVIRRLTALEREVERLRVKEKQVFVPLTTPLTSTAWDGDAYSSNGGKTLIDLSAVFGVPAGVKAVLLECAINDSGSLTYSTNGGAWIVFSGQNDESWGGQGINIEKEPNDAHRNAHMIVACNPDGDIYYRINASGTGTMDVVLRVWGYWL